MAGLQSSSKFRPAFGPQGYRTGLQEPAPQPQESTSQKRQDLPKPIDEDPRRRAEATRLPSRQVIFTMYDDVELEKLIASTSVPFAATISRSTRASPFAADTRTVPRSIDT